MTALPAPLPPLSKISDVEGILGNISEYAGNLPASAMNSKFKDENTRIIHGIWEKFQTEYPELSRIIAQPTSKDLGKLNSTLMQQMRDYDLHDKLQQI